MENVPSQYSHIKGWGVDADPKNEPTYPIKKYTGDDHRRLNYQRPPLQPVTVEVLRSIERPNVSAVYGTPLPPSGLSGQIRRLAFRYSENRLRHWMPLVLADKINVIEGIFDDLAHGHIPNFFAERGWKAEWKYNRKALVTKVAIGVVISAGIVALMVSRKRGGGMQSRVRRGRKAMVSE